MINIRKLESELWESADLLRSGSKLTSNQYCMPVLGLIFLRYAYSRFKAAETEILKNRPSRGGRVLPVEASDFKQRSALFLPREAQYDYLLTLPENIASADLKNSSGQKMNSLGEVVNNAMQLVEEQSELLRGVLPKDYTIFSDELLSELLRIFNNSALNDVGGDVIGRIYEYFLNKFAKNIASDDGVFFTPKSLVKMIVNIIEPKKGVLLDPACGSGGMFIQSGDFVTAAGEKPTHAMTFYGQEINLTTYNLCRINMFLHDIGFEKFSIAHEDTLIEPQHWDDEPFEVIVSNPPYSIKWAGSDNPLLINDPRFSPAGVLAPKSKADMAFIMHSLSWLATNGTAAIVCFPGIMYRGGAEQKIRQYLIDNNYIDCIIQLPSNLFYGTSIATCIMVLKKAKNDNKILFIDASKECIKVTNNNKLTEENISKIVGEFSSREEVRYFAHLADHSEVVENDYNLSVSTYVEQEDTREVIDIVKLNTEIREIVAREQVLRDEIDKIVMEIENNK